jgi:hypothetical protein
MTNINMFNNIFSPTQAQTNAAANAGASAAASSGAAETAASAGAAAADELMEQLMDDRNAAHTQSATATVLQALKAAGLAESNANIALANALIENNLSISRESLRYFAAQAKAYPESGLDALMAMARADIPVNAESVATVNEFMNNGMVMTSDVNALADMIETVLSDPTTSPELADSIRQAVFEAVYDSVNETNTAAADTAAQAAAETPSGAQQAQGAEANAAQAANAQAAANSAAANTAGTAAATPGAVAASGAQMAGMAGAAPAIQPEAMPYRTVATSADNITKDATAGPGSDGAGSSLSGALSGMENGQGEALGSDGQALAGAARPGAETIASGENLPPDAVDMANSEIMSFRLHEDISGRNDYNFRDFDELANALASQADEAAESSAETAKAEIPRMPEAFRQLSAKDVKQLLKNSLSTSPEKLSKENIRALYKRTTEFFEKVKEAAEQDGSHSALASKASQAQRDTSMLNALNRMYPHIELPLKLQNENAEGGLYVYTNRSGHARTDGHVTALLHLNMPNLGLIDIHLDLADTSLGMNYYCEEDAGRLLSGDISALRGDLERLGYTVRTRFNPKETAADSIRESLGSVEEAGTAERPERLSFDIRA